MASYDQLAPWFDAWQRAFGAPYDALILERVLVALTAHAPGARRVADLGAGTGDLVVALALRGFEVVAVDRAAPMLAIVARKLALAGVADRVTLEAQDLRTLHVDRPVDAAVCVYTVVNQLTADGDLARALTAVHAALAPHGILVFELNLPRAYDRYWTGTDTVRVPGARITREHARSTDGRTVAAHVTIVPDRGPALHDRIEQRPYADQEVEEALATAGLRRVAWEAYDPFGKGGEPVKTLWVVGRG